MSGPADPLTGQPTTDKSAWLSSAKGLKDMGALWCINSIANNLHSGSKDVEKDLIAECLFKDYNSSHEVGNTWCVQY